MFGALVGKNLMVNGRRTSMRLEPIVWDLLAKLAYREEMTVGAIVSAVERMADASQSEDANLSSCVRQFILAYYAEAATEGGHMAAGHGMGMLRLRSAVPRREPVGNELIAARIPSVADLPTDTLGPYPN